MLTVREALNLPVFATSRLVAGAAGLDNQIRWVHIVDIPDAHYEWARRGVLLLTAGYGLANNPERQKELVPKLVEEGFAGMVLAAGYYLSEMPTAVSEAAEALDFPLIEAPPDLFFIDVTEAVLERIVNQQYALLQQSMRIFEQLTALVLSGANLTSLAETLATLLQRSITIESPSFHVLANAQVGPVDEAREISVGHGRTTPEVAHHLIQAGIYDKLLAEKKPQRIPAMPELHMEMERYVAPIIVDEEIYGYIWMIAGERPLTDLDELTLSHGATVAALIRFKDQAVQQVEDTLRGDFLSDLLTGSRQQINLAEQARRLNFHLDRPQQLLIVHGSGGVGDKGHTLAEDIGYWLRRQQIDPLIVRREGKVVVIVERQAHTGGKELAQAMVDALTHPSQRLLVSVGQPCAALTEDGNGIRHSYEQAQEALVIGQTLNRVEGVIDFEELGMLHWLYHLPESEWRGNAYTRHIDTLHEYDGRRSANLLETLEVYLDHGGALLETAQALYIHRNTLLHRLERIEQLCRLDLRAPHHQLNLHVAVKWFRLHSA